MTDHRTIYKSVPPQPVMPKLRTTRERRLRLKERARLAGALLFAGSIMACGSSSASSHTETHNEDCTASDLAIIVYHDSVGDAIATVSAYAHYTQFSPEHVDQVGILAQPGADGDIYVTAKCGGAQYVAFVQVIEE